MQEKKLFLLDAMALVYRAYYALIRNPRITSTGINTNAQFGFTNTLLELIQKEQPTHMAVVFDTAAATERHTDFSDYKANRQDAPEDLLLALPDIKDIVRGFNIPCLEMDGYEADDIIGTLALQAAQENYKVYMVTPDKDYGQLVRENVFIYKPSYQGGGSEILGPEEVCARWNIQSVSQVIDMLGLMGDAVDNIPGIAGIGEKTASKLLATYGSLEAVLEDADNIKGALGEKIRNGKENALLSKKLATIITMVPIEFKEEDFRLKDRNKEILTEVFSRLEFKTLAKRVLQTELPDNSAQQIPRDLFGNPIRVKNYPTAPTELASQEETTVIAEPQSTVEIKTAENTPHDYQLITPEDPALPALIERLSKSQEICFDTETTSIDANQAELVGMSFSIEKGKAYYVTAPVTHEAVCNLLEKFRPVFENENIRWVGQNIKYDMLVLRWYGFTLKGNSTTPCWRTMCMNQKASVTWMH